METKPKIRALRSSLLRIPVVVASIMGVQIVRGFARICDIADISKPDIYDAKNNPTGTQRDLSPKHAKDAYVYIQNEEIGFFPEVLLSLRDKSVANLRITNESRGYAILEISLSAIRKSKDIKISRIDGNHRLDLADGHDDGFPRLTAMVSFCLAMNINKEQEIKLFRDINNNQRKMNTSHLDNIELRLSGERKVAQKDPPLFITKKLRDDGDSPFFNRVYDGGRSDSQKFVPMRSLKTGIEYMLSRPTRLTSLDDIDVQVAVIKNYFKALRSWEPEAWSAPKEYLMLRGAGLWGICFLGASVIDRALGKSQYLPEHMLAILRSGPDWDWTKGGDFQGYSGRGGALKISDMITGELEDGSGSSLKSLIKRISDEIS